MLQFFSNEAFLTKVHFVDEHFLFQPQGGRPGHHPCPTCRVASEGGAPPGAFMPGIVGRPENAVFNTVSSGSSAAPNLEAARTYFPETWIWQLIVPGSVMFLTVIQLCSHNMVLF